MKSTAFLFSLVLSSLVATAAPAQTPTAAITVTRTSDGCYIMLSPEVAKTVQDQVWLVIDGKSEGFGRYFYSPDMSSKPLHYTVSVSSDLDSQVKDILKAQGIPFRSSVTTYHIICGVNVPNNISVSKSFSFRHESNILAFTPIPETAAYKIGDKIPLLEAIALDTSLSSSGIIGNDVKKQDLMPHDLLHRITIQVQFVPKSEKTLTPP